MQEIELYRRLERGAPEARRVRHHDLAQVRRNRRNAEAERKAQRKHDAEERKAATARAKAQQAAETARARAQLAAKREGLPNGFVGDAAIEEAYWQQVQRRFRSYSIILRFAGIGQYAGVTKGPQLKKMHDDQCKIMGSNAHHALEARIWGIVAGGGALGVVAWFALQFQGELPEFLGTYGELEKARHGPVRQIRPATPGTGDDPFPVRNPPRENLRLAMACSRSSPHATPIRCL